MNTMDSTEGPAPRPQSAPQSERRYARRIDCTPRERPAAPLAAPSANDPAPSQQAPRP